MRARRRNGRRPIPIRRRSLPFTETPMNEPLAGFFVIDKAEGMTSHAVVQLLRSQLQIKKIGHLGTLDPMATGVLPLAVGRATRLARFLMGGRKVYEGTIQLGLTTDTFDRLGQPTSEFRQPDFTPDRLRTAVESMVGEQMQAPPPYSAKKIGGRRAYRLARQGLQVEIPPQRVRIHQFTFRQGATDTIDFEVHCSPGTYVRAMAHDLGQKLECGAHLSRLRRLSSGKFSLSMACPLHQGRMPGDWTRYLLSMNFMLDDMPGVRVSAEDRDAFAHGRTLGVRNVPLPPSAAPMIRILSDSGLLLGLAEIASPRHPAGHGERRSVHLLPKLVL